MVGMFWYQTFGRNPFFPRFCPLFDGPSPPFEGSSRKISQNGAPAKCYSTKNTVHTIPNINRQVPVTYRYDTGQTASKQMGCNSNIYLEEPVRVASPTRINLEEPVRVTSPTRINLEEPVRVASPTRTNLEEPISSGYPAHLGLTWRNQFLLVTQPI